MPKESTIIDPEIVEESTDLVPDWVSEANALHARCEGLKERMQAIGAELWQHAVRLGGLLEERKRSLPHGAWGKLFKANSAHVQNLKFSQDTARRYMKLYKEAAKRAGKLEGAETAERMRLMCSEGADDGELVEVLGRISTAETLRQAYFDFGVIEPPQDKNKTILNNRNTKGGPGKKEGTEAAQVPDTEKLHEESMRDGNELLRLLERYFATEKKQEHLTSGEREALCHSVIEYGKFGKNSNYKMKL